MRSRHFFIPLFLIFNTSVFGADEPIALDPIIKQGDVPVETQPQMESSVTPSTRGVFKKSSSQGGIQTTLLNDLAVPVINTGSRGPSRLMGLGVSTEDQQLETLGIPLSPAQGGGMDLNHFPQFLWSDYRYQLGGRVGSTALQGVAGNLSLTPWTESALHEGALAPRAQVGTLYSSSRLLQTSAQARGEPDMQGESTWAALVGLSSLRSRGPSGSLSAQWRGDSPWRAEFHLLGTSIDAESPGLVSYPTPRARLLTARLIPVMKVMQRLEGESTFQAIFYSDWMYIRSENPDRASDSSRNHVSRYGWKMRASASWGETGLSVERVTFNKDGFQSPVEFPISWDVKLRQDFGDLRVEPEAQVVGVSRLGVFPAGGIGFRYKTDPGVPSPFLKLSEQRRFPSLNDRYYSTPFFKGNSMLKPERVWTESLGVDWAAAGFEASMQGYFQQRKDVILADIDRKKNLGMGRVAGAQASLAAALAPGIRLSDSATWAVTQVENTASEFPYVPRILNVSQLAANLGPLEARVLARASGPAALFGQKIAGYLSWDAEVSGQVGRGIGAGGALELGARVENLFNRPLELDPGYPLERVFSVWASAGL